MTRRDLSVRAFQLLKFVDVSREMSVKSQAFFGLGCSGPHGPYLQNRICIFMWPAFPPSRRVCSFNLTDPTHAKGVSSLSNRKERRKWRENTNQKAPEDFPDWKCCQMRTALSPPCCVHFFHVVLANPFDHLPKSVLGCIDEEIRTIL